MVDMKSVLGEFYMILYPIVSAEVVVNFMPTVKNVACSTAVGLEAGCLSG